MSQPSAVHRLGAMIRKSHAKSRHGCMECKRRRVKCDETHPICAQCIKMERECTYTKPHPRRAKRRMSASQTPGQSPASSILQHSTASAEGASPSTTDSQLCASIQAPVNMVHLELLRHFEAESCKPIARSSEQVEIYRSTVMDRAIATPYLMHQVLALSATHLSLERPAKAKFYRSVALHLQAQALEGFHEVLSHLDESNCLDALFFSHALALQMFCETFTLMRDDFSGFLDKLTECISLLMGINMVIRPWWDFLKPGPIGQIMLASDLHAREDKESFGECDALRELISHADLSPSSIATCQEAAARLQAYFDTERLLGDTSGSVSLIFGWLITATPEYRELIEQRRPEALVLMGYYAVILHKRQGAWPVRDSGRWLLTSITTYLGKRWEHWLAWPNSAMIG